MKSGKLLKAAGILLVIFAALSVAAAFYGVFKLNSDVNGAVGSKQSYETAIKEAGLAAGKTIKGNHHSCVFTKGRVTWDGKKLDGMMSIIPALRDARKEGDPSVSVRKA